jgi:hypothetical protein
VKVVFALLLITRVAVAGTEIDHYRRAAALYELGDFTEAIKEFEAAYRDKAQPSLLFNLAQCHRQLRQNDKAIFYYKAFLREEPRSRMKVFIEQRIHELETSTTPSDPQSAIAVDPRATVDAAVAHAREVPAELTPRLARALADLPLPSLRRGLAFRDDANALLEWHVRAQVIDALSVRKVDYDDAEVERLASLLAFAVPRAWRDAGEDARPKVVYVLATSAKGRAALLRILDGALTPTALLVAATAPSGDEALNAAVDRVLWASYLRERDKPIAEWTEPSVYSALSQHQPQFRERLRALLIDRIHSQGRIAPTELQLYVAREEPIFKDLLDWAHNPSTEVGFPARMALFNLWYASSDPQLLALALDGAKRSVPLAETSLIFLGRSAESSADAQKTLHSALKDKSPRIVTAAVSGFAVPDKAFSARALWKWFDDQPDARFADRDWQPALMHAAEAIERFAQQSFGLHDPPVRCGFAEGQRLQVERDLALARGQTPPPPSLTAVDDAAQVAQDKERLLRARSEMRHKLHL